MCRIMDIMPLALLFIASAMPIHAQESGAEGEVEVVRVQAGAPLSVPCALRPEQRVEWRLDGAPVPADLQPAAEAPAAGGGLLARLAAPAARAAHAGLYTCAPDEPRRAVRVLVLPVSGPAPDAAAPPPALETAPAAAPAPVAPALELPPGTILLYYDVKHNLTLTCPLKPNTGGTYEWKKNGTVVSAVSELQNRYELSADNSQLSIKDRRSREEDYGEYTCAAGGEVATFEVRGRTRLSLPPDTNVVEGQKLKMQCKVTGKPYPARVEWFYSVDAAANGTLVGERAVLASSEQGVAGAELVLEAATRDDAGRYECRAPIVPGAAPFGALPTAPNVTTTLRVKDMYAALWPFLGICAEVFVLCAIILVYEKRRTKPEMEDSDTDNHEQKKS